MIKKKRTTDIEKKQVYFVEEDYEEDDKYFVAEGTPVLVLNTDHFPNITVRDADGTQMEIDSDYLSDEPATEMPDDKIIQKLYKKHNVLTISTFIALVLSIVFVVVLLVSVVIFWVWDVLLWLIVASGAVLFVSGSIAIILGSLNFGVPACYTNEHLEELRTLLENSHKNNNVNDLPSEIHVL